ncbi:MAG TPA: alpha/beta hydrolase [Caulobacteraceae bacterium]|jgi:pimeloyl-ACP methyl ester carboxylesterase|nr:alpha/beta hydrolase [Caulobacteraceae bacterium]
MNPDISGSWTGKLDSGTGQATLSFRLEPTAEGGVARLATRTVGELELPLVRRGDQWRFSAAIIDVALELWPDGERLAGECRHAGCAYPMTFERGPPPTKPKAPRPQTPTPPFPYATEAVSFTGADGTRRVGTLTTPSGPPARGAVVLSSWFGGTDRDQRTFGHRPMAIWADVLTRLGLATLRYDKRGIGESAGDFSTATTGDLAADLTEAVGFLRTLPGVDPARIGLLGHSEGGHISADVAAADPMIAFCVMLTPSGVPEEEMFDTELFRCAIAVGGRPLHPERTIALAHALSAAGRTAPTADEGRARTREILQREAAAGRFPAERIEIRAEMALAPWRRYWWNYDLTKSLRALACPILVVFAGRDLQTPPAFHAPAVRTALAANRRAALIKLPDLNHFLQRARTGAVSEYGDIEQTLAPEAMETVREWVRSASTAQAP